MRLKIVAIIFFILLSGCAGLEPLDDLDSRGEEKEEIRISPKKELGIRFLMAARQEFDFVKDPEIVSLVNRVGKDLVRAAGGNPDSYHFFVVRKNQINAFAVPGGYIFIYDGLLKNLGSIDELAGVLAHEIAHIERDHLFKDAKKSGIMDLATMAGIILAGVSGQAEAATATIAQATNISYKLKLSREHEEDADLFAIKYLRRSRYSPAGLSDSFNTLAYYGRLNSADTVPTYLSTHPAIGDRQLIVEALVKDMRTGKGLQAFAVWDWGRIVTILKAQYGEAGDLNFSGTGDNGNRPGEERRHYLRGLFALKSRNLKEALPEYLEATRLNPENPAYHSDLANIYMQLHHMEMAKRAALKSIQLSKDYAPPYILLGMLAKSEGKHEDAIKYFEEAERLFPYDPYIQYHMAGSYHALNMPARMRLHLGRYYRYNLDREKALMQFKMALEESGDEVFAKKISDEIISLKREGV